MTHAQIRIIEGHSRYESTDLLYQPLRKTLLEDTTYKTNQLLEASKISHLSHIIRPRHIEQNHELGERTYIFEDRKLKPTHDIWKVPKDHKYSIVNIQQKVYEPISYQQMTKIMEQKSYKQQIIVYTVGSQENDQQQRFGRLQFGRTQNRITNNPSKLNTTRPSSQMDNRITRVQSNQQYWNTTTKQNNQLTPKLLKLSIDDNPTRNNSRVYYKEQDRGQAQPLKKKQLLGRQRSKTFNQTQKKGYNLFSIFDQPINNLLTGNPCTCPSTSIVADRQYQISWYNNLKNTS